MKNRNLKVKRQFLSPQAEDTAHVVYGVNQEKFSKKETRHYYDAAFCISDGRQTAVLYLSVAEDKEFKDGMKKLQTLSDAVYEMQSQLEEARREYLDEVDAERAEKDASV